MLRFLRRSRPGERFAAIFVVRRDEGLKPTELAAISGGQATIAEHSLKVGDNLCLATP